MSGHMITFNQDRCISCLACELHCTAKNQIPADARLGILISTGPVNRGGKPRMLATYMTCFHCTKAWCVAACPTGAMTRREDGIVYVNQDNCVGCKACIKACPWSVPQWNADTGRVVKCDYCRDRIDEGLKPACVTACCTHALDFRNANEASRETREAYAVKQQGKRTRQGAQKD